MPKPRRKKSKIYFGTPAQEAIIETLVDWEGSKKSFKDGYYKARGIEAVN